MNYYTIYEKLLISLYFLCHLFFFLFCCKNKKYFSFMQVFGLFLFKELHNEWLQCGVSFISPRNPPFPLRGR